MDEMRSAMMKSALRVGIEKKKEEERQSSESINGRGHMTDNQLLFSDIVEASLHCSTITTVYVFL